MSTDIEIDPNAVIAGQFAHVDPGVLLGYEPGRSVDAPLTIGDGAQLRSGTVLYRGSAIGHRFQTGHHVVVREECVIGDDVSIWSNSVIDYGCTIGDGVKIHSNCYVAQFTTIESGAFLAPGVSFANDLYPGDPESAQLMRGPHIGAGAQIGVNATLLPFVSIGAGSIVGSGAVVTSDVPPGVVVAGVPARILRLVADLPPIAGRLARGEGTG
jgi:acetyltransferase-like isoleucine patch superfamily enzyme